MVVESPSSDPNFYISYYLFVPTYAIGMLLNLWILITLVRGRHHLLADRLAHCLCGLIAVDLFWSIAQLTHYAVILHVENSTDSIASRAIACLSCVSVLGVMAANLCLAAERYFVLCGRSGGGDVRYFVWLVSPLVMVAIIIISTFADCMNVTDNLVPAQSPHFEIFFSLMLASFCFVVTATVCLYVFAYFSAKKEIEGLKESVCLPIYALGILLNASVLITAVVGWKRICTTRLDRFMIVLTAVFLIWCLFSTIRPLVELNHPETFTVAFIELYTSIFLMLNFGINALIALERYFKIAETSEEDNRKHYFASIFTWFTLLLSVLFNYAYAPKLATEGALDTWFTVVSPPAMIAILIIQMYWTFAIYAGTYILSCKKIRASLEKRRNGSLDVEQIRIKLERKILLSCLAMASSLLVCYLPIFVVALFLLSSSASDPGNQHMTVPLLFANLMVCLDVLITPALVLYFMPKVRKSLVAFVTRQEEE
ncbi:hypothetical protein HDU98_010117 [Podochytrium sp. JEL0797]|nr:hypothetical protein HDU98_010117 [Podochytrium sp. JEL0797]